jgi:hypothetical protein
VASDGAAARVTHGVLNLTHRDGHETPVPLEPGRRYRVRVDLNHAAHAFPAGHRLRVAVSNAYWPLLWPSPEAVRLTLFAGAGRLDLPVRPPRPGGEAAPPPGPESAPPVARTTLREGRIERGVTRDLLTGEVVHRLFIDGGVFGPAGLIRIDEIEQELGHVMTCEYRIRDDDPLSARAEVVQSYVMARGDWRVRIEARAAMSADAQAFHLAAGLEAYEGEEQVFARTWDDSIPREGV